MVDLNDAAAGRLLASHADTVGDVLGQLARSSDLETRRTVAAHPNTPVAALLQLGHEFPRELLNNPVFSLLLLEGPDLLEKIPLRTLQSLLRQPDVPQYFLEQTAERAEVEIQTGWVLNPNTPKPVLERLLQSRDRLVQDAAKLHVNWAGELEAMDWEKVRQSQQTLRTSSGRIAADVAVALCVLAQFGLVPEQLLEEWLETRQPPEHLQICRAAAASSVTSEAMLIRLAKSSEQAIYMAAIRNRNLSWDAVGTIATQSRNSWQEICQASEAVKILEALQQSPSVPSRPKRRPSQRKPESQQVPPMIISFGRKTQKKPNSALIAAKSHKTSTDQLRQLAQHPDRTVRLAVVENPNTSLSVLLEYSARDPSTSLKLGELIAKNGKRFRFGLDNSNLIEAVLDIFSDISTEPLEQKVQSITQRGMVEHHRFLASRNDASSEVLEQLADIDDAWLQEQIADHPNTSSETLDLLSLCESEIIREAVAYNERTPNHCLIRLAQDPVKRVRKSAMQNPHLSEASVIRLLCSQQAMEMLQSRPQIEQEYPGCISPVLEHYTASKDWLVRFLACQRYAVSPEALNRVSRAEIWLERFAVARNPNASQQMLETLAQDNNQVVRFVARERLRQFSYKT